MENPAFSCFWSPSGAPLTPGISYESRRGRIAHKAGTPRLGDSSPQSSSAQGWLWGAGGEFLSTRIHPGTAPNPPLPRLQLGIFPRWGSLNPTCRGSSPKAGDGSFPPCQQPRTLQASNPTWKNPPRGISQVPAGITPNDPAGTLLQVQLGAHTQLLKEKVWGFPGQTQLVCSCTSNGLESARSLKILGSPGGQIHVCLRFTLCCVKTQFLQPCDCEKLRFCLKSAENTALVAEKCNPRKRQRLKELRGQPKPPLVPSRSHDFKFHFPAVHIQG